MRSIGGICSRLADIGDSLLNRETFRLFPQSSFGFGGSSPFGGATEEGGGINGPRSYSVLSEDYSKRFYDVGHKAKIKNPNTGLYYYITLESALAHELDHLDGHDHIVDENGVENLVITDNQKTCSDVIMGNGFVWPGH